MSAGNQIQDKDKSGPWCEFPQCDVEDASYHKEKPREGSVGTLIWGSPCET